MVESRRAEDERRQLAIAIPLLEKLNKGVKKHKVIVELNVRYFQGSGLVDLMRAIQSV